MKCAGAILQLLRLACSSRLYMCVLAITFVFVSKVQQGGDCMLRFDQ